MISLRLQISALATVALLAASAARAADYSPPMRPPQPIIEEFSGWYLRGDIGFSNQNVGSLFNVNYAGYDSVTNIDKGFDAAPLFGLGIGYTINNWLRLDVTGEYRGAANFHGLDVGALPGGGFADDRYTASKSEWTLLLNGYVDLGTWYNFTPFVGAGVGFSRNTISNFGDTSVCINSLSCAGNGGSDAYGNTASTWNLAWALHAGLAYKVTPNFTLELAYRYIDLGNARSGDLIGFNGTNNIYNPTEFRHLTSNDVKLGLRFNLDGLYESVRPLQYYSPPPPLNSKG
jgi:opacity protein-like surface antigen